VNEIAPSTDVRIGSPAAVVRDILFISKATPGDDEFALWLAPKLEEAGYRVFADVLTLEPGERWRKSLTSTLYTRAGKMLLCCSDEALAREGVQEEIGIALDLAKTLPDAKFIIPLRLAPFKKLFGIGELQYIDFVRGWADGFGKLLDALKRQKVPRDLATVNINPHWEIYRRRGAIPLKDEPERLTSNWLRMTEAPDVVRYFEPSGAVDRSAVEAACRVSLYPAEPMQRGFVSFGTEEEINETFANTGKFVLKGEVPLFKFREEGLLERDIEGKDASKVVVSMFRQAWNTYCRERGLLEYQYSGSVGFHVSPDQAKLGQRIPWGKQGDRRSSMLRNVAKGHVWQFGVTALPAFWPFPHYKLKSRVLFAPSNAVDTGDPFTDAKKQHRLRRTICKGWRNKQWHGRLMAFIELLSGESSAIVLRLSPSAEIKLEAAPVLFSSPVSTPLPNAMADEDEEEDVSTLGRPEPEPEEESP
jgi:hypothetical protein